MLVSWIVQGYPAGSSQVMPKGILAHVVPAPLPAQQAPKGGIFLTWLALVWLAMSAGCASSTWTVTSAEKDGRTDAVRAAGLPGDPERITLQEGSQVSRNYWVVADLKVAVHQSPYEAAVPTRAMVRDALRRKAAELGADAVILVRYGVVGPSPASAATLQGQGRAIKFR